MPEMTRQSILGSQRAAAPAWVSWRLRYLQLVTATLGRSLGFPAATHLARNLARGIFDLDTPIRRDIQRTVGTCLGGSEREREIIRLLTDGGPSAEQARRSAQAWWRKLPRTIDRYLEAPMLDAVRLAVAAHLLGTIKQRLIRAGLLAM